MEALRSYGDSVTCRRYSGPIYIWEPTICKLTWRLHEATGTGARVEGTGWQIVCEQAFWEHTEKPRDDTGTGLRIKGIGLQLFWEPTIWRPTGFFTGGNGMRLRVDAIE